MQQYGVNNSSVANINYSAIDFFSLARSGNFNNNLIINDSNIKVSLNYNNFGNPSANAYLDYISIEAISNLTGLDAQFAFKNNSTAFLSGIGEYNITNASTIDEVWDVTDKFNVQSKANNNSSVFNFKAISNPIA